MTTPTTNQPTPASSAAPTTTRKAGRAQTSASPAKLKTEKAGDANSFKQLTDELTRFVEQNKLSTTVQNKQFVNVEAWQYLAGRLGYVVVVPDEHLVCQNSEAEIKYLAYAYLHHVATGHQAGGGYGLASNKESGKKFYQEFAIASMAQTRAVSKCVRTAFAYYFRAAGFEPTPTEELEYDAARPAAAATQATAPAPVAEQPAAPLALNYPAPPDPEPRPVAMAVSPRDEAAAPPVEYATGEQKEQIIKLLNHPLITRQEKTKMLLNINRLDTDRAETAIKKLRSTIEEREGTTAVAE